MPHSIGCDRGEFVHIRWPDDAKLACHRFWLKENAVGQGGIDLATRECILDPADLTDEIEVKSAVVDNAGDLIVEWGMTVSDRFITRVGYAMLRKTTTDQ